MTTRFTMPFQRVFTDDGLVGAGYKLYFFQTGTSTPKNTYSDEGRTIANTHPIVANPDGVWANESGEPVNIYPDGDWSSYKSQIYTNNDVLVSGTADPVDLSTSLDLNDFSVRPTSFWGITTGTGTEYLLSPDPAIGSYSNTQTFYFQVHTDSGANPTIAMENLNSLGNYLSPILLMQYNLAGSKVAISGLKAGVRYHATNDGVHVVVLNLQTVDIVPIPQSGFTLSNNIADSNNDLDIASGIVIDSTKSRYIKLTTGLTKKIDADWEVGTNQGGRARVKTLTGTFTSSSTAITGIGSAFTTEFQVNDILYSDSKTEARVITVITDDEDMTIDSAYTTDVAVADFVKINGLAPNGRYHVIALMRQDGIVDIGFDTRVDGSLIETDSQVVAEGYNIYKKRLWGMVFFSSSTIASFIQVGRNFTFNNTIGEYFEGNTEFINYSLTTVSFTYINIKWIPYGVAKKFYFWGKASGTKPQLELTIYPSSEDELTTLAPVWFRNYGEATSLLGLGFSEAMQMTESNKIGISKNSSTAATISVTLYTRGWEELED